MDTFLSVILSAGIAGGGIWGITIKTKEFSKFIKENGWGPVKLKIRNIIIKILEITGITLLVSVYLAGLVGIPLYNDKILSNDDFTSLFIVSYLLFGIFIFYYFNAVGRRHTKNLKIIVARDSEDFKKNLLEFIHSIGQIAKALLWLVGILGIIGLIILALVLFGWFIASLSATTIIIILLVMILLK